MTMLFLGMLLQTVLSGQSDASFRTAIEDETTAPYYVIITIVNDSSGASREVCTEAPFLLGAIHIERKIPYSDRGGQRVQKIALGARGRIFRFSSSKALENIPVPYSEELLAATRKWVADFPIEDLVTVFGKTHSPVYNYYTSRKGDEYSAYKLALAHALVERGLLVRRDCVVGDLIVDRE